MTGAETMVVRRQVVVNAPQAKAFAAFTERLGDFKPPEHNLLAAPIAETGFEPRAGGMAAALPFCDALVSGHSLRALSTVADAIAGREIGAS